LNRTGKSDYFSWSRPFPEASHEPVLEEEIYAAFERIGVEPPSTEDLAPLQAA
jgi:hypothetical protein